MERVSNCIREEARAERAFFKGQKIELKVFLRLLWNRRRRKVINKDGRFLNTSGKVMRTDNGFQHGNSNLISVRI